MLELVEGETLAERIASGPLPVDEALGAARQIAEALEAAHEKGIVHRDLKRANVKLTPEGKVKVLDFGLAKALTGDPSSPDVSSSPTLTAAATQAGVVIGTAAYISPEQARGRSVDRRGDVWAFGAVLYEMLTGARPSKAIRSPTRWPPFRPRIRTGTRCRRKRRRRCGEYERVGTRRGLRRRPFADVLLRRATEALRRAVRRRRQRGRPRRGAGRALSIHEGCGGQLQAVARARPQLADGARPSGAAGAEMRPPG